MGHRLRPYGTSEEGNALTWAEAHPLIHIWGLLWDVSVLSP